MAVHSMGWLCYGNHTCRTERMIAFSNTTYTIQVYMKCMALLGTRAVTQHQEQAHAGKFASFGANALGCSTACQPVLTLGVI